MGKQSLRVIIKNIIYKLVLPIYLWSIGYKYLEDYLEDVVEHEMLLADSDRKNNLP